MTVLGYLKVPGAGLKLELTDTDALWAARMIVGEESSPYTEPAGKTATVAGGSWIVSTMLRRWATTNERRKRLGSALLWPTFTDLLRAYSQPISPKWENRGDEAHIKRRKATRELQWDEIDPSIRSTVTALFSGKRPLDGRGSGANHFAAAYLVQEKLAKGSLVKIVPSPAKNTIAADGIGTGGTEPVVTPAKRSTTPILLLVLLGLAALGVA